ncbi:ribosomal protein S12 methylthiotransferase RimO [Clostridia bacterium]|nr:ribosomal protein S12 methylthiotransferase RimO [Clostridia bacterium]
MAAKLTSAGYLLCDPYDRCDVVVINTCGFIESAKEESIAEILSAAERQSESGGKLIVTGCLAQRYKAEITEQLSEIDAAVELSGNKDIAGIADGLLSGSPTVYPRQGKTYAGDTPWSISRQTEYDALPKSSGYAYLRIADGCDNNCSYCAIPAIRGGYMAREPDDILDEARARAGSGVGELVLVAQDVTAYRYGTADTAVDLVGLLRLLTDDTALAGVRFRLLYCYPERITDALIDYMANEPRVVRYLDLPMQHCDDSILGAMNRHSTRGGLTELVRKLKERMPDIALRSTFIVGFPGETDGQWTDLCEFVRDCDFDYAGAFAYSEEEGTAAAALQYQVDGFIRQRRRDVIEEQFAVWQDMKLRRRLGSTAEVLVCERSDGGGAGYAEFQAPEIDGCVRFTGGGANVGETVKVKLTVLENGDYEGILI